MSVTDEMKKRVIVHDPGSALELDKLLWPQGNYELDRTVPYNPNGPENMKIYFLSLVGSTDPLAEKVDKFRGIGLIFKAPIPSLPTEGVDSVEKLKEAMVNVRAEPTNALLSQGYTILEYYAKDVTLVHPRALEPEKQPVKLLSKAVEAPPAEATPAPKPGAAAPELEAEPAPAPEAPATEEPPAQEPEAPAMETIGVQFRKEGEVISEHVEEVPVAEPEPDLPAEMPEMPDKETKRRYLKCQGCNFDEQCSTVPVLLDTYYGMLREHPERGCPQREEAGG